MYCTGNKANIVMIMQRDRRLLGFCGGHFVRYVNVESLCCTPESNIMLEKEKRSKVKSKTKENSQSEQDAAGAPNSSRGP